MNIVGLEYSLSRHQLEIYLSGCNPPYCIGCHNLNISDFSLGKDWKLYKDRIEEYVKTPLVTSVAIMGGEPLHQDKIELKLMLEWLNSLNTTIWLFTREETGWENLNVDYVKSGRYMKNLSSIHYSEYNLTLASDNQKIIKLRG